MSRILQLEIRDPLFKAIERQANAEGSDPATVATITSQQHFLEPLLPRDAAAAHAFRAMFGAAGCGDATAFRN